MPKLHSAKTDYAKLHSEETDYAKILRYNILCQNYAPLKHTMPKLHSNPLKHIMPKLHSTKAHYAKITLS